MTQKSKLYRNKVVIIWEYIYNIMALFLYEFILITYLKFYYFYFLSLTLVLHLANKAGQTKMLILYTLKKILWKVNKLSEAFC